MIRSLRGLRVQLLLWAIIPITVIAVAVSAVGIISHQVAMRHLIAERDAKLASVAANLLDERLRLHLRLLETLTAIDTPLPDVPEFDGGLLRLSADGAITASSPSAQGRAGQATELRSLTGGALPPDVAHISYLNTNPVTQQEGLLFSIPGREGGVLVGLASFSHLDFPQVIDSLGMGRRGTAYLVDTAGIILHHLDQQQEGHDISRRVGVAEVAQGQTGAAFQREDNGEESVVGYAPVPLAGWGLLIQEPWADAVAPLMRVSEMTPLILVLTAVAALLVIFFGMRYIIRPLQDLEQEARQVAWGNFDAIQKPVGGVEEIETLRRTLSEMTMQVRSYQAALRDYLAAVTHAEEEERRRMARELHDDTVQTLIALTHRAEMCEKAAHDPEELARRVEEVRSLAVEALNGTRRLIYNLRPLYLEDLGLAAAIETLSQDVGRTEGAPALQTEVAGEARRLAPDLELAAFRIVQEALTNVVRHARAKTAQVKVEFGETHLVLTVRDDGVGFVPPQVPQGLAQEGHFGLMGMRERALRFGGHLSVQSEPGRGTTVVINLPYYSSPSSVPDDR